MKKKNLRIQIYITIALTFLLLSVCYAVILFQFENKRRDTVVNKIVMSVNAMVQLRKNDFANDLFMNHSSAIGIMIEEMLQIQGIVGVSIFDKDGKSYAAAGVLMGGNSLDYEKEPGDAVSPGDYKYYENTLNNIKMLAYIEPIKAIGEKLGYIKILYSLEEVVKESRLSMTFFTTLIFSVLLLIAVLLHFLLSYYVTKPVGQIVAAMKDVHNGQLGVQVDLSSKNEIGVMAQTFNQMSIENEKMYNELITLNENLEQIVEKRTLELKQEEAKSRSLLENSPDFIMDIDHEFKIQYLNKPVNGSVGKGIIGNSVFDLTPSKYSREFKMVITGVMDTREKGIIETRLNFPGDEALWYEVRFGAIETDGKVAGIIMIATDITQRKRDQAKLEAVRNELIKQAHQAGMADIAIGTLHNVGNVLNSILTSVSLLKEIAEHSSTEELVKSNNMLREKMDNLEEFILNNPKGRMLLEYYLEIEVILVSEIETVRSHIDRLEDKAKTMIDVIVAQQNYAGASALTEMYNLAEIVNDGLIMQTQLLENNKISVVKELVDAPKIPLQRTKLMHILINLIKNAIDSMSGVEKENRELKFSIEHGGENILLKISDTGIGIEKENIDKIFSFGFTTKKEGHGFGLHSSANYMTEMGGTIRAESNGVGKGAEFILSFPVNNISDKK